MRRFLLSSMLFIVGIAAFALALPVMFLIAQVHLRLPGQPERAVMIIYMMVIVTLLIPGSLYLLLKRRATDPWKLCLVFFTTLVIVLVGIYLYTIKDEVNFSADFIIWSESDFVNDILKLRVGYPLYTNQANNDSFVYPPGAQLLTCLVAWMLGAATEIPVYRAIQVGFTLAAAVFAYACVVKILEINHPRGNQEQPLERNSYGVKLRTKLLWATLGVPLLFLFASNPLTNPFVHLLHNDSLTQLLTMVAFWLLLGYIQNRERKWLVGMMVIPAMGFLVKQNLVIWAVFYCLYLVIFDRPRSWKRLAVVGIVSLSLVGLVFLIGYWLYGDNYYYWVITVIGSHGVFPLRSFQHLLDVWLYVVLGLLGGLFLLRGKAARWLVGPWLTWLVLFLVQTYTSGVAWMINHIGSASLMAGVWFLAALEGFWLQFQKSSTTATTVQDAFAGSASDEKNHAMQAPTPPPRTSGQGSEQAPTPPPRTSGKGSEQAWWQVPLIIFIGVMLVAGLGFIRVPLSALPADAQRYRLQIEAEFAGRDTSKILLDVGTWVYLPAGVVMKDRAASIGERGYSQTGDFSALIARIQQRTYTRILVRNFHSPDFWYDHYLWRQSSNIRRVLQENYQEIKTIPAVQGSQNYLFSDISILVPRGK